MFQEFPKHLYARGVSVIVETREEQDALDPALWFEKPDLIPEFNPEVASEDETADTPKRGPGRPKKA